MLRREMEKQASKHPIRGIAITVGSKEIGNTSMRPPSPFQKVMGGALWPLLYFVVAPRPFLLCEGSRRTRQPADGWAYGNFAKPRFHWYRIAKRLITSLVHRKVARPFTHRSKRSLPEQNILEVSESHRVAIVDL